MGPPETVIHEYPGTDQSWALEFADFVACVETGSTPCGGLDDALRALSVVDTIYESNKP
jgi:predicted dehydrogenase